MISKEEIEKIARLARLSLTEDEKRKIRGELSQIIEYFSQLQTVDTTNVEPMSHPVDLVNVMRDDIESVASDYQSLIQQAPCRESDYFRVPKIGN